MWGYIPLRTRRRLWVQHYSERKVNKITPETETSSPAAGINVGDVSDAKITRASDTMSESSARKGAQGIS